MLTSPAAILLAVSAMGTGLGVGGGEGGGEGGIWITIGRRVGGTGVSATSTGVEVTVGGGAPPPHAVNNNRPTTTINPCKRTLITSILS